MSIFAVDDTTSALTGVSGSPFSTGLGTLSADTESVAFSPAGGLLAVVNGDGNSELGTVQVFSVDQARRQNQTPRSASWCARVHPVSPAPTMRTRRSGRCMQHTRILASTGVVHSGLVRSEILLDGTAVRPPS